LFFVFMSIVPFLSRWCADHLPRNERNRQVTPFAQRFNQTLPVHWGGGTV